MKKQDVVNRILSSGKRGSLSAVPVTAFAPTNIALCKYWGKRDVELNLPVTSSLSVSLGKKGASTTLSVAEGGQDEAMVNHQPVDVLSGFYKRLVSFLDLFRLDKQVFFRVDIETNVPIAAGLASSACGFAALTLALNQLCRWELCAQDLSILARLGSGSACRSIWPGFVEWEKGVREDGMDSVGKIIPAIWPELCIGLLMVNDQTKKISSREAMQRTVETSQLYDSWSMQAEHDLIMMKEAIRDTNFLLLGKTAESNALAMHGLMLSAWPPVSYFLPETVTAMQRIWSFREQGLSLYFTQDAGPNLKLLFLEKDKAAVQSIFPSVDVVKPFL